MDNCKRIEILGRIEIRNGMRVNIGFDFCFYYKWLIEKSIYNTLKYQTPAHGGHFTIYNPKIHAFIPEDRLKKYRGELIKIEYDPEFCIQGKRVNMFYFPAWSKRIDEIKKELAINDGVNYKGGHITVCNLKYLNNQDVKNNESQAGR